MITGTPRWAGAMIGAGVMTIYFVAGGLLGSAWVNSVQLVVMLVGFLVGAALRALDRRRAGALTAAPSPEWFGDFFYSSGPGSGWMLLALTFPSFLISPGLIQKSYGARSERGAVHRHCAQRGRARHLCVHPHGARHVGPRSGPGHDGSELRAARRC